MYASATQAPIETKNPRVNLLVTKWQHVWLLALDRRRKLNDALDRLEEVMQLSYLTQHCSKAFTHLLHKLLLLWLTITSLCICPAERICQL